MPKDPSALPLFDALAETGFQASVIATYSCYFPFFEEVVLRRLLDKGCTNNVLLVDAVRCAEAFRSDDTRPRRAGSDYTLLPVHMRGAFHPKLIVRIGKSKGSLIVGSHNMTLAGFGLNDELTNEFRTSGSGARQGAQIIHGVLDFLELFVPTNLTELLHVFRSVRRNIPWLEGPLPLPSDDRVLMTTTGQDADFWTRLRPLIPKKHVTVFTCGPFFDRHLSLIKKLISELKPHRLTVGIDPESVEIDTAATNSVPSAEFVNISGLPRVPNRRDSANTYLHAKVLWFKGSDGELLVTGSANPSAPAFLSVERRNAEAIVVDKRPGTAESLGIDTLAKAPNITAQEWIRIKSRNKIVEPAQALAAGSLLLAVPTDKGFIAERPIGKQISLDAFASDGAMLGQAITSSEDEALIMAPTELREGIQVLRSTGKEKTPVAILVHRPDQVARNVGGDRQRELRRALGALEEDPAQLDTLLKLTEKVIFDSDDVINDTNTILRKSLSAPEQAEKTKGPASLAVEAAGRRAGRKKKSLASGDILVLLDALMYRLGEGLPGHATIPGNGDTEADSTRDGDKEDDPPPAPPVPYEVLAQACRGKLGRLIRRMIKQLEAARSGSARRAIVQLAAVLSVIHTLRTMEQRIEWRAKHLNLVDSDHEWELFQNATLALSWGNNALIPRALAEGDRELFKELSLALGLLVWLAWELDVDVKAALERTTPFNPDEEDDPWYPIQLFATVAPSIAADEEAQENLSTAVNRTPRRHHDVRSWLSTHLYLCDRLASLIASPNRHTKAARQPRPGDLAILRAPLDPGVRVVLDVAPSGDTTKITVLDEESDDRERHFLATHVTCVPWMEQQQTGKGVAASRP